MPPAMDSFEVESSNAAPVREAGVKVCRSSHIVLGTLGTAVAVWAGVQKFSNSVTPLQSQEGVSLVAGTEVDAAFYDAAPTTIKGCTCRDPCEVSFLFSCRSQMYCTVENRECPGGRAEWSVTQGYYDYCQFPVYRPYEDLTAVEKKAMLLDAISSDTTLGVHPALLGVLSGAVHESVRVTFDAQGDVYPVPRTKVIHSAGWVGSVRVESYGDHPYTGLFKGAEHGLIRFSSAAEPGTSNKFTPGFGLKLLRDGQLSANLVAMPSLDGQPCSEDNFFSRNFTTKVAPTEDFGLSLIVQKFWQASYCPQQVGISDIASEPGVSPVFPYILTFRPPADLIVSFSCDVDVLRQSTDFSQGSLTPGTVLFEVLATPVPGGEPAPIGRVVLTSGFTSSKFGDEQLNFKHQRKEEDWALRPEWLDSVVPFDECGMAIASAVAPTHADGCSSPFQTQPGMLATDTTTV